MSRLSCNRRRQSIIIKVYANGRKNAKLKGVLGISEVGCLSIGDSLEQGYAIDNEELDSGVRCVACPIRDYTRRIVGAISISGPAMRFSDERIEKELIPLARQTADDLSTRLGYHK